MSRDAFSYDPQDAGDVRRRLRVAQPVSTDRLLPIRERARIRRRKPLAAAKAPKPASSIRPATNATILRAPITSGIAPISSAIPRCTP